MEHRTKRQKVEESTKISENELKRLASDEEVVKNKITEMQNELKNISQTKFQQLQNLYNHGWFFEIEWNTAKKIQFRPFATIDEAEEALESFRRAYVTSSNEYARRFARYVKIFLPEIDDKLLHRKMHNKVYMQKAADDILEVYTFAKNTEDVIALLSGDSIKISSGKKYREPLVVKKHLKDVPSLTIKREQMPTLKQFTYLKEIKKVDIAKFLEFPYDRIATLFPDPVYTQNLLDTHRARAARYWIFLAHEFDKNSLFAKLPKDVIRYLCSFMYIKEIPIEEQKE